MQGEVSILKTSLRNCVKIPNSGTNKEVRERKVEVGTFVKIKPLHVIIYHESLPTWLLLCDSLVCVTVTICGSSNMLEFEQRCTTNTSCSLVCIQAMVNRVGFSKFRFEPEYRGGITNSLVLASGSLSFISKIVSRIHDPLVVILDSRFRGRLRGGHVSGVDRHLVQHVEWHRLQHRSFGGLTDYVALAGVVGPNVTLTTFSL